MCPGVVYLFWWGESSACVSAIIHAHIQISITDLGSPFLPLVPIGRKRQEEGHGVGALEGAELLGGGENSGAGRYGVKVDVLVWFGRA